MQHFALDNNYRTATTREEVLHMLQKIERWRGEKGGEKRGRGGQASI